MISKIHLIYFSPTKTTKTVVEQVAKGVSSSELEHYNLTALESGLDKHFDNGLVIIGVPVYAGRVPEIVLKRIEGLSSMGTPAVLVSLYGNREFEDTLIELRDVMTSKGFIVIAAGAFIGEHSFSTVQQPIAVSRPDASDLQTAQEFGKKIAEKLKNNGGTTVNEIPGNSPYRKRAPLGGIAPETDTTLCTLCGTCAKVCPTHVIKVDKEVTTYAVKCIMCCACVKYCPENARALQHPRVVEIRKQLIQNCSTRKEPMVFL